MKKLLLLSLLCVPVLGMQQKLEEVKNERAASRQWVKNTAYAAAMVYPLIPSGSAVVVGGCALASLPVSVSLVAGCMAVDYMLTEKAIQKNK